jgi:hypothetical protein
MGNTTNLNSGFSPMTQARAAGFLYLIVIIAGIFAEMFVREALVVTNNASATASNILAHEMRYRLGFAAELIACACNIGLAIIFYNLFRTVNLNLTWAVVFFTIVGTSIECAVMVNHFEPLHLLKGAAYLSAFNTEQLQALAYLSLKNQAVGFSIALLFFGFYCLAIGWLIFKSGFLPRLLGILLAIEGAGYLVNSFTFFVVPDVQAVIFPFFAVTAIGEIAFCLWMLIKGVNVAKWKAKNN